MILAELDVLNPEDSSCSYSKFGDRTNYVCLLYGYSC